MHKKTAIKALSVLLTASLLVIPSLASTFTGYDSEETLRYLEERDSAYEARSEGSTVTFDADDDTIARIYTGVHPAETDGTPMLYISSKMSVSQSISRLSLPESVVGILSGKGNFLDTKGAFYGNKSIKEVIPSRNLEYIGDKAFYGSSLEYIFLPYLVRHIGCYAFAYCPSLDSVSVHGNTAIGDGAFAGCKELSEVYLSSRVQRVGLGAFEHTPFYDSLTDEFCITNGILLKYNGKGGDVVIPDGVRVIADGCFAGRTSIRSVTIPKSLRYVGNSAFRSCARLETVIFPTYSENEEEAQNLTLGENSFDGCNKLPEEVLASLASLPSDPRKMTITYENRHILTLSPISFIELINKNAALTLSEDQCTENTTTPPSEDSSSNLTQTPLQPSDLQGLPSELIIPKIPGLDPAYPTIQDGGLIYTSQESFPTLPQD